MIKEKNVLTKVLKHESFKKYQNQIKLQRISKQTHYHKYFEENKKNSELYGLVSMKLYTQQIRN